MLTVNIKIQRMIINPGSRGSIGCKTMDNWKQIDTS